jgi:hypothetical protein
MICGLFSLPRNPMAWHVDAARGTQSQFALVFAMTKLVRRHCWKRPGNGAKLGKQSQIGTQCAFMR